MRAIRYLLGPCILTVLFGVPSAAAGPPDHGFHPPMPNQRLYFQCKLTGSEARMLAEQELRMLGPRTARADGQGDRKSCDAGNRKGQSHYTSPCWPRIGGHHTYFWESHLAIGGHHTCFLGRVAHLVSHLS